MNERNNITWPELLKKVMRSDDWSRLDESEDSRLRSRWEEVVGVLEKKRSSAKPKTRKICASCGFEIPDTENRCVECGGVAA